MREVDFLPKWYKDKTRRKLMAQRQYIALGIIFLIMIFSNAVASRKISRANADLTRSDTERGHAERFMVEFGRLNSRVTETRAAVASVNRLNLELDVANVLAELSTVVSGEIVLQSVELVSREPAEQTVARETAQAPFYSDDAGERRAERFSVRLIGFAHHAGHVAALIDELENSATFRDVNLVYSKASAEALAGEPAPSAQVSEQTSQKLFEFEVSCTVAVGHGIEHGDE
ncbi:MAG: PilN domain-containing protein [Planctomycetes bacterium]|nr:PilN domain-containing protein [Planctomycetota bacterium]